MDQMCKAGHTIFKEKCPKCRSLRSEYYALLKQTGFVDIERGKDSVQVLDLGSPQLLKHRTAFKTEGVFEARRSYYDWARSKLNDKGSFKSERDMLIWEAHAEGYSTRRIAPMVGLEQSWLVRKIQGIRCYLKEEPTAVSSSNMIMNILK